MLMTIDSVTKGPIPTMSVMLMDMSEEGNFEHLAALGFMLLVATLVIVGGASALLGRDFMLRRNS